MGGFLNWWDGVELWLSGLAVRRPDDRRDARRAGAGLRLAILLDGVLGNGIRLLRRARRHPRTRSRERMPRSRVTLVLVILVVLVIVMWLLTR